jgi:hypothetical protein
MMPETKTSRVKYAGWGKIEVTIGSRTLTFRDCKVWPGGATGWDWRITNTHHQPGTQPADVEEILEHGIDTMVLSRGASLALGTCPETEDLLRDRGIEYYIEETKKAVDLYNSLVEQGKRVGGIFHSTC